MKLLKLYTSIALGTVLVSTSAIADSNAARWPAGFPTRVKTKAEAEACCLPKEKVALACKDCKTVSERNGEDKKNILAWFKPDLTHGCSGCGGKIKVTPAASGRVAFNEYIHTCSKCGPKSAFTCATHKS
jgi:hypothetical protein